MNGVAIVGTYSRCYESRTGKCKTVSKKTQRWHVASNTESKIHFIYPGVASPWGSIYRGDQGFYYNVWSALNQLPHWLITQSGGGGGWTSLLLYTTAFGACQWVALTCCRLLASLTQSSSWRLLSVGAPFAPFGLAASGRNSVFLQNKSLVPGSCRGAISGEDPSKPPPAQIVARRSLHPRWKRGL
jgi:hypothetical protein